MDNYSSVPDPRRESTLAINRMCFSYTEARSATNVTKRKLSCENILDLKQNLNFAQYSAGPRSVQTVPCKTKLISSNASDPCILSSLSKETSNISTCKSHTKLSDSEASVETIDTYSVDSGIPVETLTAQINQV